MKSDSSIAFVVDALPALGGGEKVLMAALNVFPHAEIFSLVYNKKAFVDTPLADRNIKTSFIDRIPLSHHNHRMFLPLMPLAIERFELQDFETIVSFNYAVAHGIQNPGGARHLSYTYTPMRYAWTNLNINGITKHKSPLIELFMKYFRLWDKRAASRVHQFAAISQAVSRRIADAYQRQAVVIYPPVDVERFNPPTERESFYITVTRLVPHKRVDILVDAFARLKFPLVIIGDGPELQRLKGQATPNIQFLGYQSDEKVAEYLGRARGFVCATEEDFGIAIVEAQAAGCPVIAYGSGGALETVIEGVTGVYFSEQTADCLTEAILKFESMQSFFCTSDLVRNAKRFNKENFKQAFSNFVKASKRN
ncbi:MAG TPA: glycosyltransferase [Anaerolineales bacterium]|nr:glycosyltransferase [Anaerolineales bacterium]